MEKKNILILGASGGIAQSFLYMFQHYRNLFDKLILVDKSSSFLKRENIDHSSLKYKFVEIEVDPIKNKDEYLKLLIANRINIVIDLTDADTLPLLRLTNSLGISYINTALNDADETISEISKVIFKDKKSYCNSPHILCSGMNPGVVNMWVRFGIEKFGIPKEIIHFEYDTAVLKNGWKPMITWSIHEFLVEAVSDPSGVALGRGNTKKLLPNGLTHQIDMTSILSPILQLEKYPFGLQILHEENLTIAEKYDIPSQFIYAIYPKTIEYLEKLYEKDHNIQNSQLLQGDNVKNKLDGSDNIGVLLQYSNKKVYYFNSISNNSLTHMSATSFQVIIGVFCALFTLLESNLNSGIYFVEDLYDTVYPSYLFSMMKVEEIIFSKRSYLSNSKIIFPEKNIRQKTTHFQLQ